MQQLMLFNCQNVKIETLKKLIYIWAKDISPYMSKYTMIPQVRDFFFFNSGSEEVLIKLR